ncbi:MAG TPA: flagellar filament capping protein FliD [Opitutaceae bacterium]|nr:flagellar filament capping protein FliD [Opitutaceae bacterium]
MATDFSLSGLASGFDWKSFIDSIMQAEQAPITRLQTEKSTNSSKISAFDQLNTKITALQTAANALNDSSLFSATSAKSTNSASSWTVAASSATPQGAYAINVSRLATATQQVGTGDIGAGIASSNDVSGLTLASMSTATAVTAGVFTVNGSQVTVATTDSLQQVFDKISTATGGAVTGSYDSTTDKISLASSSNIVLGAANDTSNFLRVAKLTNNGSTSVSSSSTLGSLKQTVPLANAGLRNAITAVDGSGNGSFTINGVAITYNANTDSLASVVSKINASSAGVTAAYDPVNDKMSLTNKSTGNTAINLSEAAGGFLDALGIRGGTTTFGVDAQYTVNNGPVLSSASNTFDVSSHGIPGLSVTANSTTTETINVAGDPTNARKAIDTFITNYNAVQQYIDDQTKITTTSDKVKAELLSGNREIQDWARNFRSKAFSAVDGVSGTISRLESLGIDFASGTSNLTVKDSTKLDAALRDHPSDVASFFAKSDGGFAKRISDFATTIVGTGTSSTGLLNVQKNNLTNANTSIDAQIATIQRQLDAEKQRLTDSFIAMESAQSTISQQQSALTKAFSTTSSS